MRPHSTKNIQIGKFKLTYFEYQEYGIQGVGKNHTPIVNMDPYINHNMDDELHVEMCKGLVLSREFDPGRCNGAIPPEEKERYFDRDCLALTLSSLNEIDKNGVHRKAIEDIINTVDEDLIHPSVYRYCQYALGSYVPWFFTLYLKHSTFYEKTLVNDSWTKDSVYFPKLKEYVLTLPFKHVGRIKVFATYPNAGVVTHRDGIVTKHKDHCINLFFSGSRPTFIYDEIKKEKVYLEKGAKSYFFNNRDYHGVDPEPVFRYTVRVDGTFNDDMIDILQLENGYV